MTEQRTSGATDRVAIIADDGSIGACGLEQLCERGVPGYELDPAPAIGARHYDLVHLYRSGPAALAAVAAARERTLPVIATYDPAGETTTAYAGLGIPPEHIVPWTLGVDLERFHPARYAPEALPGGFNVLYVGPLHREHGLDLLADAFLIARNRDPRIRLVLAGTGPDRAALWLRLGAAATFLGELDPEALPTIYATADLLVCTTQRGGLGHIILEAQASGLPVLAVESDTATALIESGRSGCLVTRDPEALASAIRGLARRETLCDRLSTGGLMAVRERSVERSAARLATAYAHAIGTARFPAEVARAA